MAELTMEKLEVLYTLVAKSTADCPTLGTTAHLALK